MERNHILIGLFVLFLVYWWYVNYYEGFEVAEPAEKLSKIDTSEAQKDSNALPPRLQNYIGRPRVADTIKLDGLGRNPNWNIFRSPPTKRSGPGPAGYKVDYDVPGGLYSAGLGK